MRAGGGGGVVGGGSSAGRFHRWSGQCVATESSMRYASQLICSDARDRPFGSLWFPLALTGSHLRPSATLPGEVVCTCHPKACVIVGGRWVPADGSNSRRSAPLLEEAWPRSGDEAGCNPQVAADLDLV